MFKTQRYTTWDRHFFCFAIANWVQNKGSLSMFCIAPGVSIMINAVIATVNKLYDCFMIQNGLKWYKQTILVF